VAYLGRIVGSPPGLPGGGITGVVPASGVGARISGSTPAGGHITPSDFASLSPSDSLDARPTVEPLEPPGAPLPLEGIGAQLEDCAGAGGAVRCVGVVDVGGCCAWLAPNDAVRAHASRTTDFLAGFLADLFHMQTKRLPRAVVPTRIQDLR
jgi:hypothetical protein